MLNVLRLLLLLVGVALFGYLVSIADWIRIFGLVGGLGWGFIPVLAIYAGAFAVDTASWQLVIDHAPLTWRWFAALWRIRLVGMAANQLTPLVGLAGEPLKAVLLKRRLGVAYREGAASLLVAKTANLLALAIFLAVGTAFAVADGNLPPTYRTTVAIGAGLVVSGIALVFAMQRLRILSKLGRRAAMVRLLDGDGAFDDLLVDAYTRRRSQFLVATLLTLLNWILGAVELYTILRLLDAPITLSGAWGVQAAVELVRAVTFFIPAGLGAQEAIFVVMLTPVTGDASSALAAALIRRARELLWIGAGLASAWGAFGASRSDGRRHDG